LISLKPGLIWRLRRREAEEEIARQAAAEVAGQVVGTVSATPQPLLHPHHPHRRTPKLAVAISQVVGVEAAEAGEAVGEAEAEGAEAAAVEAGTHTIGIMS
jgi:hypothetical protein